MTEEPSSSWREASRALEVQAVYRHPQGKRIIVFTDGTFECRGPDGKKKSTSATPEKLAEGFGQWERVL